jgi:hypothetical protein
LSAAVFCGRRYLPDWITLEEAFALRGEVLVRALRGGAIRPEGCTSIQSENPAHWITMPAVIWQRDANFIGEPGFPQLDGRAIQGMICVFRTGRWWEVRLRRAEVEALPRSPEMAQRAARDWLLRRAAEAKCRLKQKAEFADCKAATGVTWREYLAAFRQLPAECRYKRGWP